MTLDCSTEPLGYHLLRKSSTTDRCDPRTNHELLIQSMHEPGVADPCVNLMLLIHPDPCTILDLLIHPDTCTYLELLIHPDPYSVCLCVCMYILVFCMSGDSPGSDG